MLFLLVLVCCQSASQEAEQRTNFTDTTAVSRSESSLPQPFDTVDIKYLLGKFEPEADPLFEPIDSRYSAGSARSQYIRKDVQAAFVRMWEAARDSGITLTILSGTRNFWYQKQIWEAKWTGARRVGGENLSQAVPDPAERALRILRYSSMPGTSRHHWGTDVDLNDFNNSYFAAGPGLKVYQWLSEHAADYGFCQVYSAKGEARPYGYEEEKWHWSYLPVADRYLKSYQLRVEPEMLSGFQGSEVASNIDVIERYVMGINPACQNWE
jgi:zinc D-Ala-D-Ala carboxypeptidase